MDMTETDYTTLFRAARKAAAGLASESDEKISRMLLDLADEIIRHSDDLLEANSEDLARMSQDNPMYDRLKLDGKRLESIAADMRNVASLPSPAGRILSETVRPNGMVIRKVSVPFGVIGIIYEARPNVSFDVFSLCVKSGNACILKGGSDAQNSNSAITGLIRSVLAEHGFDEKLGARPLERLIRDEILAKLADTLLFQSEKGVDTVRISAGKDGIILKTLAAGHSGPER